MKDYRDPKIQNELRKIRLTPESTKPPIKTFSTVNYINMLVNVSFFESPICRLSYFSNPKADFRKAAEEWPAQKEIFEKLDFFQKEVYKFDDLRWMSSCLVNRDGVYFLQILIKCKQSNKRKYIRFIEDSLGITPKEVSLNFG